MIACYFKYSSDLSNQVISAFTTLLCDMIYYLFKVLFHQQVAHEYSLKNYNDFAVVVQPGIRDGTPENTPVAFISNVSLIVI